MTNKKNIFTVGLRTLSLKGLKRSNKTFWQCIWFCLEVGDRLLLATRQAKNYFLSFTVFKLNNLKITHFDVIISYPNRKSINLQKCIDCLHLTGNRISKFATFFVIRKSCFNLRVIILTKYAYYRFALLKTRDVILRWLAYLGIKQSLF